MTYKAASLMETVMAIAVITICSAVAVMLFTSVLNTTPVLKAFEYRSEMDELVAQTIANNDISPLTQNGKGYRLEKEVEAQEIPNLYKVTFTLQGTKTIVKRELLLYHISHEN